jgi:hypothetical protein
MAIAKFHSNRGEKSALILVRPNEFVFSAEPVYVPRTALRDDIKEGDDIDIPDGFKLVTMVGEDGENLTTKDGAELKMLSY